MALLEEQVAIVQELQQKMTEQDDLIGRLRMVVDSDSLRQVRSLLGANADLGNDVCNSIVAVNAAPVGAQCKPSPRIHSHASMLEGRLVSCTPAGALTSFPV